MRVTDGLGGLVLRRECGPSEKEMKRGQMRLKTRRAEFVRAWRAVRDEHRVLQHSLCACVLDHSWRDGERTWR